MSMSRTLHLYIFCDALGWEIDRRRPVAADIMSYRSPLDTIFGYSSTCDPTILTGLMPSEHGHFSCFYFGPKTSPFRPLAPFALLPRALRDRGRVRNVISRLAKKLYGYTGYFQLYNMPFGLLKYFDYSEKRDIYEPGGILSGAPTIFAKWKEAGLKYHVSRWGAPEAVRVAEAEAAISAGEIDCAYVYLADLDAVLHRVGPIGEEADRKLDQYGEIIRRLYGLAADRYDRVSVHMFSDHGMTAVTKTVDLMSAVAKAGLVFGVDYAAVYDSTMARFWFLKDGAQAKIEDALRGCKDGAWLPKSKLADYGCNFADDKYGQAFFVLNPGVLLCPSFMGSTPLAGMHGYAPEDKNSTAIYATNDNNGPTPKRLDDLFELMLVPTRPEPLAVAL